jgi:hypothetical protein
VDFLFLPRQPVELQFLADTKIDMTRFCISSLKVRLRPHFFTGAFITEIVFVVRDVGSGMMRDFTANLAHETYYKAPTPEQLKATIKKHVMQLIEHEVDECLFVNDEQVTDPHPELNYWREQRARRNAQAAEDVEALMRGVSKEALREAAKKLLTTGETCEDPKTKQTPVTETGMLQAAQLKTTPDMTALMKSAGLMK